VAGTGYEREEISEFVQVLAGVVEVDYLGCGGGNRAAARFQIRYVA
jgi:hypothetical protein